AASPFTASRQEQDESHHIPTEPVVARKPKDAVNAAFPVNFPLGAYGRTAAAERPKTVAFTNAIVWTCGEAGVISNATILVEKGVIQAVGRDVTIPDGATV